MKQTGTSFKKRGRESAPGVRGEKGAKADEMVGEIRKEDLKKERSGDGGAGGSGKGSGN